MILGSTLDMGVGPFLFFHTVNLVVQSLPLEYYTTKINSLPVILEIISLFKEQMVSHKRSTTFSNVENSCGSCQNTSPSHGRLRRWKTKSLSSLKAGISDASRCRSGNAQFGRFFVSVRKGGEQRGGFPRGENEGLHGYGKPSPEKQESDAQGQGAAVRHALAAG